MEGYYKKNIKDVESQEVKVGNSKDTYIQWLITDKQEKAYAMRRFIIKPDGFIQLHYHDYFESLYIIKGKCSVRVNKENMELHQGDFIFIDTKATHEIKNTGKIDLEFICVINYTENMKIIPVYEGNSENKMEK
ncbi:cupin domain-containing protein [Ferroplasma sp.]|uniref:cupin domain-containing protein n=1 Tax=Ferroplasma sp. TaxID=2591003 RepID=UPI00307DF436